MPDSLRSQVYLVVKEKIIELYPETEEQNTIADDNQEASKETAMEFLLVESHIQNDQHDEELEWYLREQPLKEKEKCLQWWSRSGHNFPLLSQIAKCCLCIPATSVPAEGAFFHSWFVHQ